MRHRLKLLLAVMLIISGCTYQYTKNPNWEQWHAQRKDEPSFVINMNLEDCTDCFDAFIDSGYALVPKDLISIFGDTLRRDIMITGMFPDDLSDNSSWLFESSTYGYKVKGKLIGYDTLRYQTTAPVLYIESWEKIIWKDSAR
ncbi:hypothetical protein D3C71_441960 [compost metagenome]